MLTFAAFLYSAILTEPCDSLPPQPPMTPIMTVAADDGDDFDPFPPTEPGQRVRPGDVNDDGWIDQQDVEGTVRIILGGNTAGLVKAAADLNGDNKITISDLVCIINKL